MDAGLHGEGHGGGGGVAGGPGQAGGLGGQGACPAGVAFVDVGPDRLADEDLRGQVRLVGRLVECVGEQFVGAVQVLSA
ncbi:hypothetical protein ACFQY4_17925 [Catellatospora bangladeshensis]|uniref:hypothetical protein n=1 Tax=Catellatospora bangladeshensis TaxID=310355 RepID=UPI0036080200